MVRFESKELTNNCLNSGVVMPSFLTYKLKAIVDLPNSFRKCVASIHLSFLSIKPKASARLDPARLSHDGASAINCWVGPAKDLINISTVKFGFNSSAFVQIARN